MDRTSERKRVWYSIVRYLPNVIKGELINIGIIMNVPYTGEIHYMIINPDNSKFRAVWNNSIDKKTYKLGYTVFNHIIKSIDDNELHFGLNPSSDTFIPQFTSQNLPNCFIFSDVRFGKTSETKNLFENIANEYVGKKFIDEEIGTNSMIVKSRAIELIERNENANILIKRNIKIQPIGELSKFYTFDFGYSILEKAELIQTVPERKQSAYDWLERMNIITENYEHARKFIFLFNSNSESNKDNTINQMISYLKSKDQRVESYDIFSNGGKYDFNKLLNRIENEADSVHELERYLA